MLLVTVDYSLYFAILPVTQNKMKYLYLGQKRQEHMNVILGKERISENNSKAQALYIIYIYFQLNNIY